MATYFSTPSFSNELFENENGQNQTAPPENRKGTKFKYKSFLYRLIAYLIDFSILFFLNSLIYLLTDGSPIPPSKVIFTLFNRLGYIQPAYGFIVFLLYNAGFEASPFQATPGKSLINLKVTDLKGQRISFWRAILRNILKPLSFILLMVGYIMILFSKKSQGLHDLISKTLVTHGKIDAINRSKISAIIWIVSGFLFVILVVIPAFFNTASSFKSSLQDVKVRDVFFKLPSEWQYTVENYETDEFEIVCKPLDYTLKKSLTIRGYDLTLDNGLSNQEVAEMLYNLFQEMSETYKSMDIKNIKHIETTSFGIWPASSVYFTEVNQTENIIHQTIVFSVAEKRIIFEFESPLRDENYSIIGIIENTLDYKDQRH
jgi:uncharacterized RDD family membrane protein YckC